MPEAEIGLWWSLERQKGYVSIGWTQDAMLFRWARQNRSRRTISASATGLSLIVAVPRSINSICSGAEPAARSSEETGVILRGIMSMLLLLISSLSNDLTASIVDLARALPCWKQPMVQSCPCASTRRSVIHHWQFYESMHDVHEGQDSET